MTNDDRPTLPLDHEPLNREERRHPRRAADEPDPANPAFGEGGDDKQAYAGRPDQGVNRLTGPGTGGATQDRGRITEHEGRHQPSRPNG
jgi:hypothetical protein